MYRELGLELYNATSLDEMSAAMRALQDFERAARFTVEQRSTNGAATSVVVAGADGDDHFRQVAMSFYKSSSGVGRGGDSGFEGAQKAALAAQLERERKRAEKEGRVIQTF